MIKQLFDPANLVTASGLCLATIGIALTVAGFPEIGLAAVLLALLADHLDGVVAKRTVGRAPETGEIGKNLDSLADLVSAGVFPAIALMVVADMSPIAIACGALLVIASALRLSYFNVFGSPGGRFIGVPTTYAVPLTAILFLLRPGLPAALFPILFGCAIVILAVMHIAPVRIPKTSGFMYVVVTAFCILSSLFLALRGLGFWA